MNNIWDKLYNALAKLEKSDIQPDGIILHKLDAKYNFYLVKYEELGYPLGKNKKGFNKWFNREWRNFKNESA